MLESKRRALIFIGLSVLLAAIAGFMFLQKVKQLNVKAEQLNAELGEMTEVYVAADDIASRTVIREDQIKTIEMPKRYVSDSYITSIETFAQQVSVLPLSEGDIITKKMLKPIPKIRDAGNRLVAMLASEHVRFDQGLQDNDRVDIIVSQSLDGKPDTELFMQDVRIARTLASEDEFKGIALEVPFEKAPELIHMQNYADSIRILKANVGKPGAEPEEPDGEKRTESKDDQSKKKDRQKENSGNDKKDDKKKSDDKKEKDE